MKLTTVLLIAFCLQASAAAFSQRVTLNAQNASLERIFKEIKKQTGYQFFYADELVHNAKKVTVNIRNATIRQALDACFEKQLLGYTISDNTVIVKRKPEPDPEKELLFLTAPLAINVSGKVTNEQGQPLEGATVTIKGTTLATKTGTDGAFSLTTDPDAVLVISFVGFETVEVAVNNRSQLNVSLSPSYSTAEQVVVVGYGTQKRSDITGAVSQVDLEKATAIPTTNIAEMIRGQAAGVQVTLGSARPGGVSGILIRGTRSITGGNSPLVVLDGFPIENINDVNPDDIASIEILKDASSQAIYGARASNGVILITTKKGKAGRMKVSVHSYLTAQKLTKNFDLYSPEEFAQYRREAKRTENGGTYLPNDADNFGGATAPEYLNYAADNYADWEDAVLRTGVISSNTVSLSGGTDNTRIFTSLNYFSQTGLIPSSGYKRGSFRFNINQKINDRASIEANLNISTDNQQKETTGLDFITISPFTGPYDLDGNLVNNVAGINSSSSTINPLWSIREATDAIKVDLYNLNLVGNYRLAKGLSYKINTLFSRRLTDEGSYRTRLHEQGKGLVNGKAVVANGIRQEYLIENILNYDLKINNDHKLDFTAVQSLNQINNSRTTTTGTNFPNDLLGYDGISSALNFKTVREEDRRRLISFMGRVRYSFLDKYLLTVTARQDGASVFSANDKWAFFPAVAAAWKMNQESFLKNVSAINELKLRASYGQVGNQALSPFQTLGLVSTYNYVFGGNLYGGSLPGNALPNPDITWETSSTFNLGLDFGLVENRITGSVEYYNTNTTKLLLPVPVNSLTGFTTTIANSGESKNSGIELLLTGNIIRQRDMKWSVTTIFAKNKNQIVKSGLVNEDGSPRDDENNSRFIGSPIGVIYSYVFDGIFQTDKEAAESPQSKAPFSQTANTLAAGAVRIKDVNSDGIIDDADKMIIRTAPDWFGSVSTNFSFKGFELFADIYIVKGATKRNPYLSDFNEGGTYQSVRNGIKVDYWTPERPSNSYPRPNFKTAPSNIGLINIVDASYVRLRTISLSYTVPPVLIDKLHISDVKLYLTGTNLITSTKYKSYSPENNPNDFPDARSFTVGLNLGL